MCLEFKVKDVEPSEFKCDVDYDSSLSPMSHDLLLVLFVPPDADHRRLPHQICQYVTFRLA